MTISKNESETGLTLALQGESDLRDAAGLKTALLECLELARPTILHARAVESVDFTLLQLVQSACRTFRAAGVPFSVKGGAPFLRGWNEAGFAPLEDVQP